SKTPWYPRGWYLDDNDESVAWRWQDDPNCGEYFDGNCWGIDVISQAGGDDLYAEVTMLDRRGNVIDYANDDASGVEAGETAKLNFETYENAATARLKEIDCY